MSSDFPGTKSLSGLNDLNIFPKIQKLSKAKFSQFDRTRGDKNKIFRTKDISYFLQIFLKINSNFDFPMKVSRNISTVLSQSLYALLGGVE